MGEVDAGKSPGFVDKQLAPSKQAVAGVRALIGLPPATPPADSKGPQPTATQAKAHAAKDIADGVGGVAGQLGAVSNALLNPVGAIAGQIAGKMDSVIADLTGPLSAILPAFPAATLTKVGLGIPHAHVGHPPSGPPPVPPTPLPPLGPVMFGTCETVFINGMPAARCGDIGLNPTCCGLPPMAMYEIFTGSSKVFIGGSRAARATLDITWHCKSGPPGAKGAAGAASAASCVSKMAKVVAVVEKVASVAGKVATVASIASAGAGLVEAAAGDDSEATANAALCLGNAIGAAMSAAMGKDQPAIPPTGTLGMLLMGSPNVMIGGLPLPSSSQMASGLLKKILPKKFTAGIGGFVGAPP